MYEFFDSFLTGGMMICAVMIIIWIFRIRKMGVTAYLMATAFLVMGFLLLSIKFHMDPLWVTILSVLLAILLILDIGVRLFHQGVNRK